VFAVFLNTDPYTYLGTRGLSLAPGTTLDDPLAAITFRSLSPARLLPVVAASLGLPRSSPAANPTVNFRSDVTEATVVASRAVPWQVDGDYLGTATELVVHHQPDALDLVVPLASAAFD